MPINNVMLFMCDGNVTITKLGEKTLSGDTITRIDVDEPYINVFSERDGKEVLNYQIANTIPHIVNYFAAKQELVNE